MATLGVALAQVPLKEDAVNDDVSPIHNVSGPVKVTVGLAITFAAIGSERQAGLLDVKVKDTEPADIAVTIPVLVTVATALLLLIHVPPEPGLIKVA